jgi:hypothetical protein
MANYLLPVQIQVANLAGAGATIGATSIILSSFKDIDGNNLAMASFGQTAYGTLEPNNSTQEEQISFTGITQNANGTATLTGVKHVLFISPFTESSGLTKTHPGGVKFIITNSSGFYNQFVTKANTQTITGLLTLTKNPTIPGGGASLEAANNDDIANAITGVSGKATNLVYGTAKLSVAAASATVPIAVGSNDWATTTNYGISKLSTAPASATVPIAVGDNDARVPTTGENDALVGDSQSIAVGTGNKYVTQTGFQTGREIYGTSTGVGTDYAVGLAPVVSAYTPGLVVRFMPDTASSGGATLNLNSLGAKTIVTGPNSQTILTANDIPANVISEVIYDGTNFEINNPKNGSKKVKASTTQVSYTGGTTATNLVSFWLPGLILGTNNAIRVTCYVSTFTSQINKAEAIAFRYGGTTVGSVSFSSTAALNLTGKIEVLLMGAGTTSTQEGSIFASLGGGTIGSATDVRVTNQSSSGTSSIDSTVRQAFNIIVTPADSSNAITIENYLVERIS